MTIIAKRNWWQWLLDNGSYKLVALFVTVILWVTILGRRDFTMTRDMEVTVSVPTPYSVVAPVNTPVQVKVSGSRMALKRFSQSTRVIEVDVSRVREGTRSILIPADSVDLPVGVKLISIHPNRVMAQIVKVEDGQDGQK